MKLTSTGIPDVNGLTLEERKRFLAWWYDEFYPVHFLCESNDNFVMRQANEKLRLDYEKQVLLNAVELEKEKHEIEKLKMQAEKLKIERLIHPSSLIDYDKMNEKDFESYACRIINATHNTINKGSDGSLPNMSIEVKSGVEVGKKDIDVLISNMKAEGNSKGLLIHRGRVTRPAYDLAKENGIEIRHIAHLLGE